MDTAEAGTRASDTPLDVVYDGFMSYSHAADDLLAPRLQAGLQRFAKPWWKRRALRVFRDEASLSANPHLWSSITEALDDSGWFVLLLSPDAAESPWVNREVEYWLAHKDSDRIIPVLTDGEFAWADGDIVSDASPPALQGAFSDEPRWVDLRFARSEEQLDLKNHRFSAAVADVAAALRGVPKDELESEEVKQHRRTVRTAWVGGLALLLLAAAAVAGGLFAVGQRNEAQTQAEIAQAERDRALAAEDAASQAAESEARQAEIARAEAERAEHSAAVARSQQLAASAVSVLDDNPELSMLLALESIAATPTDAGVSSAGVLVLRDALLANRLLKRFPVPEGFSFARISSDGETIFQSSESERTVSAIDVETGAILWTYQDLTTVDGFRRVGLSPDGQSVTVEVIDVPFVEDESVAVDEDGNDQHPARIVVLRASDGEVLQMIQTGSCQFPTAYGNGFSRDGQWFAVATGTESCHQDPDADWASIYDTSTWEEAFRLQVEGGLSEEVVFSADSSRILIYGAQGPTELWSFPELALLNSLGDSEWATLSPDGQQVVRDIESVDLRPLLMNADTGERTAFLDAVDDFLSFDPFSFSRDGTKIAVTTRVSDFVFDAQSGRLLAKLGERGFTTSHSFTADGSMLLTATDAGLLLWDLGGGLEEIGVPIEPPGLDTIWIQPNYVVDGPTLAVMSLVDDGVQEGSAAIAISLLDPASGQVTDHISGEGVQLPDGRFAVIRQTTFEEEDDRLVGPIVIWDPTSGEVTELTDCSALWSELVGVGEIECPGGEAFYGWNAGNSIPPPVAIAVDGSFLAADSYAPADSPSSVRIWDTATLNVRSEFEIPRNHWLMAAGPNWLAHYDVHLSSVVIYDLDSGSVLATLDKGGLTSLSALSPDGSLFYVPDPFGGVWVFDTSTWETVAHWEAHAAGIRGLAIEADGTRLITTGEDNFVKVWNVSQLHGLAESQPPPLLDRIPAPKPSDAAWLSEDRIGVFLALDAKWLDVSLSVDELVADAHRHLTRGFTAGECATYQIDPCPTSLEAIRSGSA